MPPPTKKPVTTVPSTTAGETSKRTLAPSGTIRRPRAETPDDDSERVEDNYDGEDDDEEEEKEEEKTGPKRGKAAKVKSKPALVSKTFASCTTASDVSQIGIGRGPTHMVAAPAPPRGRPTPFPSALVFEPAPRPPDRGAGGADPPFLHRRRLKNARSPRPNVHTKYKQICANMSATTTLANNEPFFICYYLFPS
jgi:hypothetical protein